MHLVWLQLELFLNDGLDRSDLASVLRYAHHAAMQDRERDKRSGAQWLKSVLSYLEYGAGDSWRRLSDPAQRWHPERQWYLSGIRQVRSVLAGIPSVSALPTRLLDKKTDELRLVRLRAQTRLWLVNELMRLEPRYTDRALLSRLNRAKLARLVADAQDNRSGLKERIA